MESLCDKAQYIDEMYICWYTGEPCTISGLPNKFECKRYWDSIKKDKIKRRKENIINGDNGRFL